MIAIGLIDQVEGELSLQADPSFRRFLADFHTEALSAMLLNLFSAGFACDRQEIRRNIILILSTSTPNALRAKARPRPPHRRPRRCLRIPS